MDKYEYLTGKYLGYKPGVAERAKFEYCPLGEVLSGKIKKDKQNNKTDEIVKNDKHNKNLVNNQQHNFAKFKDVSSFKELSSDSVQKKLNEFHKIYYV